MFLLERLVGVAAYSVVLAFVWLLLAFSNLKVQAVLRVYLVLLALLAFFYEPYITADLYRINETMALFSAFSFQRFLTQFVVHSSIPAGRILYWIIGKTGVYGLLPALNTVICYACFFHILAKTAELYQISRLNLALSLLFFMSIGHFMSVISNIRTMLATAIVCCCFFRESVEKKFSWTHILCYAAAFFAHNLALVFIALRLLTPVLNRGRPLSKRVFYFAVAAGCAVVAVSFGNLVVEDVLEKAMDYLAGGYSYAWEYLIGGLILLCAAYLLKIRRKLHDAATDYDICLICCCLVSLVSTPVFSVFYRFASGIIPALLIPTLMLCLEQDHEIQPDWNGTKRLSAQSVIFMASMVILFLSCTRGSLCSYKFFTL